MSHSETLEAMSIEALRAELRAREPNTTYASEKGITRVGRRLLSGFRSLMSRPVSLDMAGISRSMIDDLREFDNSEIIRVLREKQCQVYGPDDRMDILDLTPPEVLRVSQSVVALFSARDVIDNGNGTSTLKTSNFGRTFGLCDQEPFRHQPCGGLGTGFLLSDNAIATAGHNLSEANVTRTMFIFGFRMIDSSTPSETIANTDVYRGRRILDQKVVRGGADWAIVELDRTVANQAAIKARKSGRIRDGESVYVLGHPAGLPLKYAGNAVVRDNSPASYFIANLDTYGGNSGSPVFNATTHEVEGILVRGEHDFVTQGSCKVSLVCPNTGCRGEDCTRTTEFARFVP